MSVFRNKYRELNPDEAALVDAIKSKADEMLELINGKLPISQQAPDGGLVNIEPRQAALARTKLEETVMWAVKSITG